MTTTLTAMPYVKRTFFDTTSGVAVVAAGYKLFTYSAGTSTKVNTYTDALAGGTNTNPIILDSAGQADIFLVASSYKFVLAPPTDTDPPSSPIWSEDNILSVGSTSANTDVPATFGANVTVGQSVYMSDGSGGKNAGQWYLGDATNTYSSTTAPAVGFSLSTVSSGATGSVRTAGEVTGLSGLTGGTTYYISGTPGAITSSAPANARKILAADTTTSGIILDDPQYTIVPTTDFQTFLSSGTWTIPAHAMWVDVICYGAGSGGSGGQTVVGAGAASGAGVGGGGGARVQRRFRPADLSSPVTVTVGTGGTGGTGGSGTGGTGGNTTFGSYVIAYGAVGGATGAPATPNGGSSGGGSGSAGLIGGSGNVAGGAPGGSNGGDSVTPNVFSENGGGGTTGADHGHGAVSGGGGGGSNTAAGGVGKEGGTSMFGGGGGGGGGGVTAANANSAGAAGGAVSPVGAITHGGGGAAGTAGAAFNSNQNGAAGNDVFGGTGGGGGGGRRDSTTAAAGGNGGQPGGGGGGGGAGQNGSAGGAGGNGGDGACYVVTGIGSTTAQ